MSLQLNRVHIYETPPGSSISRLTKTQPYVSIAVDGSPPIFVQKGVPYSRGGDVVDPLPDWFWDEASRVTPAVAEQTGLAKLIERRSNGKKAPKRKTAPVALPPIVVEDEGEDDESESSPAVTGWE